ncbi:hypothetical protein EB796_002525 [Bugula neritina]|uniref:Uncharacterized protein n=1 Tax=Bugula neritina TaxID=10212 RepID=A0A7J7KLX6_BUGNE|nr:hypothetical protein EB796_002525 [Bugula neritina]
MTVEWNQTEEVIQRLLSHTKGRQALIQKHIPVVLYSVAAVNNDVDDVAHRLRRWELPPLTSPVYSISDAINNPTTLQPAPPTSSRSPAEEPRSPVRRARFFRLSSENARLSLNSSVASANDQTAHSSRTNPFATRDRLTNDRVATNQATNNDLSTDLLNSDRVTNDPPHSNSLASASNSHSLESGTRTTSREVPSSSTSELSVAQPPALTLGSSSQSNTHTPSIRNLSTAGPGHLLERRQSSQPDNTLHSSASVMSPTPSPLRTRSQTSRPPLRSSATANPFTITWPPATGPSQSGSRRVTRQELRRNAAERSRRDANT